MASPLRAPTIKIVIPAVLAAAAVTGCGSSSTSGPSDAVKQFISAVRSSDGQKACSLLTPHAQSQVVTGSFTCQQAFKQLGPLLAPQLTNVKVGDASVHGDSATVPVSTSQRKAVYSLQKTGGRWEISSVARR